MDRNFRILILLCLTFSLLAAAPLHAAEKVLLDFNETGASGSTWPGWTWYPNGADDYGKAGWRKNDGKWYSGTGSNWYPRNHAINGYGNINLATVDAANRAPSTSTGSSLKVYDTGASSVYQAGWYYLWGDNFQTKGYADSTTNRMDFYFKMTGVAPLPTTSFPGNANVHIGTYTCWTGGGYAGESCPTESNNGHFYHYLTASPGAWIHVVLDRHPTHRRDAPGPANNPVSPQNYYSVLDGFYVEIRNPQSQITNYWLDEVKLWTQTQQENDESITSPWIGYWPSTGKWDVGFNDMSFGAPAKLNGTTQSAFEIRYSTSPITNENYSSAKVITPELWRRGSTNSFVRPDSWSLPVFTRFTLPADVVANNSKIYFAIKDVSSTANGDGHNAPSPYIKTIDYSLSASAKIASPLNLKVTAVK